MINFHYRSGSSIGSSIGKKYWSFPVACGMIISDENSTWLKHSTTCGNCKRTKVFKDA